MNERADGGAPPGPTRRTVAKAIAWTLPVIAVAVPAPAYAVSQAVVLQGIGAACKLPGNSGNLYKGYALGFSVENTHDVPILITIDELTLNGVDLGNLQVINLIGCTKLGSDSFTVPPRTFYPRLVVLTKAAVSSQAGTLVATYTITGGAGGTVTVTAEVDSVPPIQSGACSEFTAEEKRCIAQQNRAQ